MCHFIEGFRIVNCNSSDLLKQLSACALRSIELTMKEKEAWSLNADNNLWGAAPSRATGIHGLSDVRHIVWGRRPYAAHTRSPSSNVQRR
jgi:hypothetical protein